MHIQMTPQALLTQFNYPINEQTIAQMSKIIENTVGFEDFSKHLLSLKDALIPSDGVIALSNSQNYLKIKCDENSAHSTIDAFNEVVHHWANKYKITLQKVGAKPTYYIIGQK